MRILLVFIISMFISISTFAANTCPAKLTYGHEKDSMAYTINLDDLDIRDYGPDYLAQSIAIIRSLLEIRGCEKTDINFKETPLGRTAKSRCVMVVPQVEMSRVCYVESSIGFFSISWDMLTSTHIIYNRWD